jgi:DNA-binding protein HU-beta
VWKKESEVMNKTELIKKVAAENGLSQKAAAAAVDSVLTSITDSLAAREPVTLIGFGTFTCRHRDARVGRNPANGKQIKIAASNTPIFKAGKAFKEKVN